ncbi:hypothetical protein D3C76_332590 [compost metagenome]
MPAFMGILFIIIGFLNICFPSFAWYLKEGWKVDGDSEPSETYLALTRLGGIVAVVIGIFVFLSGLFS